MSSHDALHLLPGTSDNAKGLAHVIPDAVAANDLTLPRGAVCDSCNSYLGLVLARYGRRADTVWGLPVRSPFWLAFTIICLSACGNDPQDSDPCADGLIVAVRSSAQPEFAWTPSVCLVSSVLVSGPGGSGEIWALFSLDGGNSIDSPVRYGQPPSADQGERGGAPLTPGTTYGVQLKRLVDGEERPVGTQNFVPTQP